MFCDCPNDPAATVIDGVPTCAKCGLPLRSDGVPTTAPWSVELRAQDGPFIIGGETHEAVVAEVYPQGDGDGLEELANAKLLAAAPALRDALRAMCDHYVDVNTPFEDDEERQAVEKADAAFALLK